MIKRSGTEHNEDLEELSFIKSRVPNIGQEGSGHKIDQEDFAEDVPDGAVIKVKVKAGWRS